MRADQDNATPAARIGAGAAKALQKAFQPDLAADARLQGLIDQLEQTWPPSPPPAPPAIAS